MCFGFVTGADIVLSFDGHQMMKVLPQGTSLRGNDDNIAVDFRTSSPNGVLLSMVPKGGSLGYLQLGLENGRLRAECSLGAASRVISPTVFTFNLKSILRKTGFL